MSAAGTDLWRVTTGKTMCLTDVPSVARPAAGGFVEERVSMESILKNARKGAPTVKDAAKLLRRQHAQMVRTVNGVIDAELGTMNPTLAATDWGTGHKHGLLNVRARLLAALAKQKGSEK